MKTICTALCHRLTDESIDIRLGQAICCLVAVAIVPTSVVALLRNPGSRAEFLFGLGLACQVGLLCAMLGPLCRRGMGLGDRFAFRIRWPEFASYAASIGLLVMGIRWVAG